MTQLLSGHPVITVERATNRGEADTISVHGLEAAHAEWVAQTLPLSIQQQRGAWWLPEVVPRCAGAEVHPAPRGTRPCADREGARR
jgi:hypothetical protein